MENTNDERQPAPAEGAAHLRSPVHLFSCSSQAEHPRAPVWLAAAYLIFLFGYGHFGANGLYDHDGYFHARYAQMFPSRGLSREFPWTQASTWKDRFCDKEFLYHLLMVPFAWDDQDPIRGVRAYGLLLSLAVCLTMYLVLRAQGVPWPWFFTLALAFASGAFLARLTMVRSHVLSIMLILIGMHLLLKQRWKALLVLGFLYSWSYATPWILVAVALPFVAARWMAGAPFDWRSPLAAAAGIVLGLALHPYTPLTLETLFTYVDVLRLAGADKGTAELTMASELYPLDGREFLLTYPLIHLALAGLCLAGWVLGRKLTPQAVGALAAALVWYAMLMAFQRASEYAVPLTVLAVALVVRDVLAAADVRRELLQARPALAKVLLTLGGMAVAAGFAASLRAQIYATSLAQPPRFHGAAVWMAQHLPPGETVVNLWWDDFSDLYYDGHRQHYLCGLDGTYMLRWNREKAVLLEQMRSGARPLDGPRLAEAFAARYMVLQRATAQQYPELRSGAWKPVYQDSTAAIYDLSQGYKPIGD